MLMPDAAPKRITRVAPNWRARHLHRLDHLHLANNLLHNPPLLAKI